MNRAAQIDEKKTHIQTIPNNNSAKSVHESYQLRQTGPFRVGMSICLLNLCLRRLLPHAAHIQYFYCNIHYSVCQEKSSHLSDFYLKYFSTWSDKWGEFKSCGTVNNFIYQIRD